MPASSALFANRTQPSMSGNAAGDMVFVVSTRDVSWAVFIATSPPLGNIQWNLRFMTTLITLHHPTFNESDRTSGTAIMRPAHSQFYLTPQPRRRVETSEPRRSKPLEIRSVGLDFTRGLDPLPRMG